jgi:hypothetical protein
MTTGIERLRGFVHGVAFATLLACGCGTSFSDFHAGHPHQAVGKGSQLLAATDSVLMAIQFEDTDGRDVTFSAKVASRDRKPHRFQIRNARLAFEGHSAAWSSPRSFDVQLGAAPSFVLLKFPMEEIAGKIWGGPFHQQIARLREGKLRLILETLLDGSPEEVSLVLGVEVLYPELQLDEPR